ncbi:PREDICTED: odorant receptor 33b-like [Wasmannia auropunctata]|uniref:odorant receptor 33b-like n=1 Tax=Wasmannia auropunctata TaxID=64793 RepID=UPI0005ED8D64|nr:PREDICTED: odorant receptor 33b-like [Wasmannia auropunctata]
MIFWWKKEAIVPIMNMMEKDWIKPMNDQERRLMIRKAKSARTIIIFSYCIMGIQCCFLLIPPALGMSMRLTPNITDPGKPMILQSYYIYDITKRPQYEVTFISQAIYAVFGLMIYIGIDNFLSLLIFHVSGQLEIIKIRLICLNKYINYHEMLRYCIDKHIRLLRAIDVIEDTYNLILLTLFIYFAVLFAFYAYRIISVFDEGNRLPVIRLLFFIATILNLFGHMCLYCALGEMLVAQCNNVYYAAYSNKWYTMNPRIANDQLILMTRGSKSIYLTVGKISPVTMATFCGLVKTSMGYLSFLHTTR